MKRRSLLILVSLALVSCSRNEKKVSENQLPAGPQTALCKERKLTILGTNDIHGNFEGKIFSISGANGPKKTVGGLDLFAGIVKNARDLADDCNGVLVLDGGDQFQGTLISNYNEGVVMGQVMKEIGYDAIVPGNHDYDFGPIGWENDSVAHAQEAEFSENNHLTSLERFALRAQIKMKSKAAAATLSDAIVSEIPVDPKSPKSTIIQFRNTSGIPLVSANTYRLDSLKDESGASVPASLIGCRPAVAGQSIDWSKAKRPDFLASHVVKEIAGMKVAIVGLDIASTPNITTKANVMDLCFRDPAQEFLSLSKELKKSVDAIVVVAHMGDATADAISMTRPAKKDGTDKEIDDMTITGFLDRVLTSPECENGACIDAMVGGHAHAVNNVRISGVPGIQSGSNAQRFGRIELSFDKDKKPLREKTVAVAGKYMVLDQCDTGTEKFCKVTPKGAEYDGQLLIANQRVIDVVGNEKKKVELLAERVLGNAREEITPHRYLENALGNRLADMLLLTGKSSNAEVAFLNSGGIRSSLKAGAVTYNSFYQVQPFNNRAVLIPNFKVSDLVVAVKKSIKSCGSFGALNFAGIRAQFKKDCVSDANKQSQEDPNAELLKVETTAGEVLYDASLPEAERIPNDRELKLVTLDFLAEGGSAFSAAFRPEHMKQVIARPYRELFVDLWLAGPFDWDNKRDGRLKNLFVPPPAPPVTR